MTKDIGAGGDASGEPGPPGDRAGVLGAEIDAWLADHAVGIAQLADSPAAVDARTRYAQSSLSPAAARAITEAATRPASDGAPDGDPDGDPVDDPVDDPDGASAPGDAQEAALAELDRAVAGTTVLGLGHAVAGTHELATLATRIVEHLARDGGARVLAIDASASTTTAVDDYVQGDVEGAASDALEALDRLGLTSWRTREGVAVIEALRDLNRERPPEQRVRVIGLDPVLPASSVLAVSRVLRTAAPDVFESLAPDMAGLVAPASADRLRTAVETAGSALDDPAVLAAADPDELAAARRHLPLLRRAAEYVAAGDDAPSVRPQLMAEAVLEASATATSAGAGPAVLLWGHADHVLVHDDPVPTTGHRLRAALGEGYYALGLLGGRGDFRAPRDRKRRGPTRALQVHRFSAVSGLASDLLATAGTDHVVDLRAARAAAPSVASWCDAPTSIRVLGEVVPRGVDRTPSRRVVPGLVADGWATVERVRSATPR